MVKGIVFDLWGTLVENGVFPSPVRQVQKILRIEDPFQDYIVKFEEIFMLRNFDNLAEAFKDVAKSFGVTANDYQIDSLVGLWNKNRLFAKPYPETIKTLEELKEKYKIALLSNTDGFSVEPVLEKYDLAKFFDVISLSYKSGKLKTDPKIFEMIAKELKLKKPDLIMVGDSLESDMGGAEKAGVKGVLVDRRERREYTQKITTLSELNKFL